ncbi:MFS transporter [Streptomyces sp. NPDC057694]|uniref:MFS transporter n=1 Tax=Streptomyces sp. NPDC057694 TaxID=3346216 RepID=UPI00369EA205
MPENSPSVPLAGAGSGPAAPPKDLAAGRHVPGRWRQLSVLSPTVLTDNSESSVVSTLFAAMRQTLGMSLSHLGLLQALSRVVGAVSGPLWVAAARRAGRRSVLVGTGLWMGGWLAACGLSQNFPQLLTCYLLAAVGAAAGQPLVHDVVADLFDETSRGRAIGTMYGAVTLLGAVIGPLVAQLAEAPGGWRSGFYAVGALCVLAALLVLFLFRDPGSGASEATAPAAQDTAGAFSRQTLRRLFGIPTFGLMVVQRLLSGHLLVAGFGIVFLTERGFGTATAALIAIPSGVGYLLGSVAGGLITDRVHRANPEHGRVRTLQVLQLLYAGLAFLGTQIDWHGIGAYLLLFGAMAAVQGANPGVNRPIVMAVTPPDLRGPAFAVLISVAEAIAYALFNLGAGALGDALGLQTVFLWVLVVLMVANAAFCGLLHRTYPRDVARVRDGEV